MSDRRIRLAEIVLDAETREPEATPVLRLELFYSKGGPNYMNGGQNPKGFAVSGLVVEKHPDGAESFMLGAAHAALIEMSERFNAKRLAALAPILQRPHQHMTGPFQPYIEKLLNVARRACAAHAPTTKAPDVLVAMAGVPS